MVLFGFDEVFWEAVLSKFRFLLSGGRQGYKGIISDALALNKEEKYPDEESAVHPHSSRM